MKLSNRNTSTHLSFLILTLTAGLLILQSCGQDPSGPDFSTVPPPYDTSQAVQDSTTSDGLTIYVIEEGSGVFNVVSRDQVQIRYTGRTADGRVFDSSFVNGFTTPRTFRNLTPNAINTANGPVSPLINGFRRGIIGMKEGERRTVVIPPSLGYGDSQDGTNGFDLREDTLRFDIELVSIVTSN